MEDIGNLGEAVLQKMCFQAGIAVNQSMVDVNGWDAILEFPLDINSSAIPVHESQIQCKVQVKATRSRKKSWDIALSNLQKMATYNGVSLYLFLEFDVSAEVEKAYLVHLDRSIIWKVLQRVDKEKEGGKASSLHKKTMAIKYGKENCMSKVHGEVLKDLIEGFVGDSFSKYVAEKKEFLEKAGYEDDRYEIAFETNDVESLVTFHEMSLGVDKELKVSKAQAFEKRFGLKRPVDIISGAGVVKMDNVKPKSKGVVQFKEEDQFFGIAHEMQIYISPLTPAVPDEAKCFRMDSDALEMFIYPFTGKVTYRFKVEYRKRYKLKELERALELVKFFTASSKKAICTISSPGESDIHFTMHREGGSFEQADDLREIKSLLKIEENYGLRDFFSISPQEINAKSVVIRHLSNMLFKDELHIRMELGDDVKGQVDEISGVALFQGMVLNGYLIGVILYLKLSNNAIIDGGRFYETVPVSILESIFCVSGKLSEDDIVEMMEKSVTAKIPEEDKVLILDFRAEKKSVEESAE